LISRRTRAMSWRSAGFASVTTGPSTSIGSNWRHMRLPDGPSRKQRLRTRRRHHDFPGVRGRSPRPERQTPDSVPKGAAARATQIGPEPGTGLSYVHPHGEPTGLTHEPSPRPESGRSRLEKFQKGPPPNCFSYTVLGSSCSEEHVEE
jgi:hypothetical protein